MGVEHKDMSPERESMPPERKLVPPEREPVPGQRELMQFSSPKIADGQELSIDASKPAFQITQRFNMLKTLDGRLRTKPRQSWLRACGTFARRPQIGG